MQLNLSPKIKSKLNLVENKELYDMITSNADRFNHAYAMKEQTAKVMFGKKFMWNDKGEYQLFHVMDECISNVK